MTPPITAPVTGPMGTGLSFTGMTDLGITKGMDLQYILTDKTLQLYLCVGTEANRVLITGTSPLSRQAAVLNAIDTHGKWGQNIELWMVSEKAGVVAARTRAVNYKAHVKPFHGTLTISSIKADNPAMTYPGNGKGRLLSPLINNRYYFMYASKLETDDANRGFDCTTFPMVLLQIPRLPPPGYGKQLCDAAGAVQCEHEAVKSPDLAREFVDNTTPLGLFILFSAGHVLLYDGYLNMLYEFNYGGFKDTPAGSRSLSGAPQGLWWMRKIAESHRPAFT